MIGIMAEVLPLNPSPEDMARHVNRLAEDSKNVVITHHARDRMGERRITSRHLMTCLRKGRVIVGPYKAVNGDWRCTMVRAVSGMDITAAIAVNFEDDLIVVTVF